MSIGIQNPNTISANDIPVLDLTRLQDCLKSPSALTGFGTLGTHNSEEVIFLFVEMEIM